MRQCVKRQHAQPIYMVVVACMLTGLGWAGEATDATAKPDAGKKLSEVKPTIRTIQDRYRQIKNKEYDLADVAQVGENLEYQVRWKSIPAGTIALRVKRTKRMGDRKAYNLEMRIESNDFLSVIYPVQSSITSLADIENGRSYLFKRNLSEGRRRVDDRLQFDYGYKNADGRIEPVAQYSKIKKGETQTKRPKPIPGPVQDALSVVYYLRSLAFDKEGDSHELLLGSHKRVDVVTIKAKEFKQKRTAVGTFDCIVVEPKGDANADRTNIVSTKGKTIIYLEKNTRIPVFMTVDVPFGVATASLIKAEKTDLLKYDIKNKEPELLENPEEK